MKRIVLIVLSLLLTISLLAGCSSSLRSEEAVNDSVTGYGSGEFTNSGDGRDKSDSDYQSEPEEAPSVEIPGDYVEGGYYEEGRKTIKTANAKIEVENFDDAYESLKAMIGSNGYIEETNIWKTPSYYQGEKIMLTNGNIRIRIKASAFTGFTEGLTTLGTVLSSGSLEDDISDMYYDTEARLKLLEDEKARLEEYAEKLDDPEVFFKTQERITQVIYEMERLQGTLKRWDSQVEFSTVSITINEKHPGEDSSLTEPKGFFERIWDNIKDGVDFLGDVLIFFAGILPLLAILAVIAVVVVVIVRRSRRKNSRKE